MLPSILLSVAATLALGSQTQPADTPATQTEARLRYRIRQPLRLIYVGQDRHSESRRMPQGWALSEERARKFFSTVYVAPTTGPGGTPRRRVLILSVTILAKDLAFGRDVTAETQRRPSRGRWVTLDDFEIDEAGRLMGATTTDQADSIFALVAGRHVEVPPLAKEPLVAGRAAEEPVVAQEGKFVIVRRVGREPVNEGGTACARVRLHLRQEPGQEKFTLEGWETDQLIDRATGLLMTDQTRVRYLQAPYRHDVNSFVKQVRRTPISRAAFDRARAELVALKDVSKALSAGDLDGAERQLTDLVRRFPEPAFEEQQAPLQEYLQDVRALADPQPGKRRLYLNDIDTYFWLNVPADYDRKRPYRLLILLHGASAPPETYFQSWIKPLEGKPVILAALKSRGHSWDPDADQQTIKRLVDALSGTYRIDSRNVFLLGHSAGAIMAYVAALAQDDVPIRGAVVSAGTLHPQLRGAIQRQSDEAVLKRLRRTSLYVMVGTEDRQFPPPNVKADASLLKGMGASVVYRELPNHGHAYPASENPAIADWLMKQ